MLYLLRVLRRGALAGLILLVLGGCGGQHSSTPPTSPPSVTSLGAGGPDTQPPLEPTGAGPTLPPVNGVTLDVAGLPIGDGSVVATSSDGSSNCLTIFWAGHLPPWAVLTVTDVAIGGPFKAVDVATAGCASAPSRLPACIGDRLTPADNGGASCFVGVEWNQSSTDGTVTLVGQLACQTVGTSQCQQLRDSLVSGAKPISFTFSPPTTQPTDTSTTQPTTSSS